MTNDVFCSISSKFSSNFSSIVPSFMRKTYSSSSTRYPVQNLSTMQLYFFSVVNFCIVEVKIFRVFGHLTFRVFACSIAPSDWSIKSISKNRSINISRETIHSPQATSSALFFYIDGILSIKFFICSTSSGFSFSILVFSSAFA